MEKKYPNQLVVIGIHSPKFESEKNSASIRKAVLRYEVQHPVINDADLKIWKTYGVGGWPTVFLIDPEGYIVGSAFQEKLFDPLDKAITRLIRTHRVQGTLNENPLHFGKVRNEGKNSPLYFPGKVVADGPGNRLFIADSTHHRIVVTDLNGKKIAIAGTGQPGHADGPFAKASFADPQGMALHGQILYVADRKNNLIRALDLKALTVRTIAGTGRQGQDRRLGGAALRVGLNSPWDLLVHGNTLFIAMAGHHQIWALDLTRKMLYPFAGNAMENIVDGPRASSCFAQPSGLASDGTTLYVADSEVSAIRALPLNGRGNVRTLVGAGLFEFGDVDGVGPRARLQHALGVVFHGGKLYVADTYNNKIKVLDPTSRSCITFWGGKAEGAQFHEPAGISYAADKLYVADTNAHRICVIDLKTEAVSTLKLEGVEAPRP